jgi:hypothetical protein
MYLQYIYDYDSQTSSEFEHNWKIDQLIHKQSYEWNTQIKCLIETEDSPESTFAIFTKLLWNT